ncbi:SnoaL-like domain-containing protein [Fodinibius salinus]|uniref:SnoaL-like domain-containing protein n=1 Tax=Fodinibius salinus TaxID=860790 RepID=A0A5D3YKR4_9BACT|nr:SnoaL-like domain-containing protein [Fodinibius salinus]
MKKYLILFVVLCAVSCTGSLDRVPSTDKVNQVLDDWHNAAEDADFGRYFNHFASDSAIFMGTDATERWTVAEFRPWAKPYFDRGKAWNFTPVERHVSFSDNGRTAWFDESLDTPNLGPARGSGVLIYQKGEWKIAHYNLSIPIPNTIADTVVAQVEKALQEQSSNNSN